MTIDYIVVPRMNKCSECKKVYSSCDTGGCKKFYAHKYTSVITQDEYKCSINNTTVIVDKKWKN